MVILLVIITLLFVKHFLADFAYQPPFQWQNKGTYGHLGGLVHTAQHVVLTVLILAFFGVGFWPITVVAVGEALVHYHTDWAKMNINKHFGWGATTHNQFWVLTGFDQLVHALTYMGIGFYLLGYYS